MLTKQDVYRQVAQLHMQGLNQGFLARLGPRFLTLLYEKIDETADYHLITHEKDGQVVGFASGGPGMGLIYRVLLSSWLRLMISLVPSIFLPKNVWGIWELLRHKAQEHSTSLPKHELLSIAVAVEHQGSGIAETLFRGLSTAFKDSGVVAFKIVVGDKLDRAKKFYLKMHVEPKAKIEVHRGSSSTVFVACSIFPDETRACSRSP